MPKHSLTQKELEDFWENYKTDEDVSGDSSECSSISSSESVDMEESVVENANVTKSGDSK